MNKKKRKQQKGWTAEEVRKICEYAKANSEELTSNLLINIVTGYMRFRKHRRFFINMGSHLGRPPKNCKSKFQKLEKTIYIECLKVPERHYELFCYARKRQPDQVNYNFTKWAGRAESNAKKRLSFSNKVMSKKSNSKVNKEKIIFFNYFEKNIMAGRKVDTRGNGVASLPNHQENPEWRHLYFERAQRSPGKPKFY